MSRERRTSEKKIERKLSVSEIKERDKQYHPCIVTNKSNSSRSISYLDDFQISQLIAMEYKVDSTVDPDRKIKKVIEINNPDIMCDVCQVRDSSNRQKILRANSRIYYSDGGQRTVCNDHYHLEAGIEKIEVLPSSSKIICTACTLENSTYKFPARRKIIYTNKLEKLVCFHHLDILNGSEENVIEYWQDKF